jgi:hypothetical protein
MKRYFLPPALLVTSLVAGGCLCFPKNNEPDPSTRIGGPSIEKPKKKQAEPKPAPPPAPEAPPAPEPEPPPEPEPAPAPVAATPLPEPDSGTCGAFVVQGTRMLWGMGVVTGIRDPALARKIADARARKQIAVLLEYHLATLQRAQHPDPLTRPVIQWELTLQNLEIADRWVVAAENAHFAVAVVELEQCGLEKDLAEKLWERLTNLTPQPPFPTRDGGL